MDSGAAGEGAPCLDCGTALVGPYCFRCGQSAHVHRTVHAWWHDFTHGVLHVEGAAWRTLGWLFTRPGALTRRYIDGQRRRFVSPLALYLFAVFLLYLTFAVLGGTGIDFADGHGGATALRAGRQQVERQLADLRRRRDAELDPEDRAELDGAMRKLRASMPRSAAPVVVEDERPADGLAGAKVDTGWPVLDRKLTRAIHDPELLLFKLEANGYKFSWALIPLSMPLMGLLFVWRRDIHLFDHAVFVTYSMCFASLLAAAMIAWSRIAFLPSAGWLLLLYPIHLHAQLRGGYGFGRIAAAAATLAVGTAAAVAFTGWVTLILLLGLAQ